LSTDTDAIAKALRKSDTGLVEVSEDNKKVRRAPSRAIERTLSKQDKMLQPEQYIVKVFPVIQVLMNWKNSLLIKERYLTSSCGEMQMVYSRDRCL